MCTRMLVTAPNELADYLAQAGVWCSHLWPSIRFEPVADIPVATSVAELQCMPDMTAIDPLVISPPADLVPSVRSVPGAVMVMSANVLTLRQVGRRAWVEKQFADVNIDIIGIQEGRNPDASGRIAGNFAKFTAGTSTATAGCEVWISTRLRPSLDNCSVAFASSRLIIVKARTSKIHADIVSAHALPNDCDESDRADMWAFFSSTLRKYCDHNIPVYVCIDANARLGAVVSPFVGDLSPEPENSNDTLFHDALRSCSRAVRSTFFYDPLRTWVSSQCTEHRIDFVLVWSSMLGIVTDAGTSRDVDLTIHDKADHCAVFVRALLPSGDSICSSLVCRRRMHIDPAWLNDVDAVTRSTTWFLLIAIAVFPLALLLSVMF